MSDSMETGIVVTASTIQITKEFLLSRESDIASGWEDLGELRPLFTELFGREPKDQEIAHANPRNSPGTRRRL